MLTLNNVTLICVVGDPNTERLQTKINLAKLALKYSKRGIKFDSVKLLTSIDFENDDDEVEAVKIDTLNYELYNKFIVYELHKYFHTSHVLIVQDDGYVINPHKWQDNFLNFDYVGAPFGLPPAEDKISCRDHFGEIIRVGNGGFSLRTKKLLELPSKLNLEWKSYFGFFNEDGFFCAHNRHYFTKAGCNFAPLEVAKYFSHETEIPETYNIEPFGFHGKWSKHISKAYLKNSLS